MSDIISQRIRESAEIIAASGERNKEQILAAAGMIIEAVRAGHKLLIFGNGGSAADSQHIAAEFIGRFQKERRAFAAVALTTDSSIMTALGNDYSFDIIFSRQIEGLGVRGDVAWGLSTSGNSANVIAGIKKAHEMGLSTIGFSGKDGGLLAQNCDVSIVVPSPVTARIQESHICMAHIICELVETALIAK